MKFRALIAAVAGASLLLTGCATGQRAQTAIAVPVIDGVGANVGSINLRAITIVNPANGSYPSGGTASVQLYIINNGAPDQLISVSSPAAKSVSLFANAAAAFAVPSTTAAPTPPPTTPTPTPASSTPTAASTSKSTAKASGSTSAAAASSTSSTSTAAAPTTATAASSSPSTPPVMINLASGETTTVGTDAKSAQIMLVGLNSALYPAMSIPITFTFANAGSVTVTVSVHLSTGGVNAPTLATSHASIED